MCGHSFAQNVWLELIAIAMLTSPGSINYICYVDRLE